MANTYILLLCLSIVVSRSRGVPFVTKRVSFHNPIDIDFGGWRPIRGQSADPMQTAASEAMDKHFLTVPVAVETDAEHVLSETDINQIREHVITNWRQKPVKEETFGQHVNSLVTKLLPKPEVELEVAETADDAEARDDQNEYTFVKMDKRNETEENTFHAYFAPKQHVPPEGYVRLTRQEFQALFKNAEILFI